MTDSTTATPITTTGTDAEKISTESKQGWRKILPVHPAAELFPLMSEAEIRELADDIKKHGLRERVVLWDDPTLGTCLLDGRNRLDALELLGTVEAPNSISRIYECPIQQRDFDPYAYVLSKNVYRRHLNLEQRRILIANVLKAKPEASNLQIAKLTGTSDKTVGKVRADLESRSEIPNVETRTDTRGRAQPARRHTPEPAPPEPKTPGIVVPLKGPAPKPMTSHQFMDRAWPTFRDVYCSALTEMAKSDPAGARDCAAKMHAAIDEAIEAAHDDHPVALQ